MKKSFLRVGTALMVAFLIACSGGDSPKGVAQNFLKAYSKMDFEGAKQYGTEETAKMLDMFSSLTKMMPDSAKGKEVKTEITAEKIEGDKATVTYTEEGKPGDQTLNLAKVDGKWKVVMSKDNMNGGAGAMDSGATNTDSTANAAMTDTTAKQ